MLQCFPIATFLPMSPKLPITVPSPLLVLPQITKEIPDDNSFSRSNVIAYGDSIPQFGFGRSYTPPYVLSSRRLKSFVRADDSFRHGIQQRNVSKFKSDHFSAPSL
jgi:hypothetical protein